MNFFFKKCLEGHQSNSLIFAKDESIMEFNFMTDTIKEIAQFPLPLEYQPDFFVMSSDQKNCLIANQDDVIFYNQKKNKFMDLNEDSECQISSIKEVIFDDEEKEFYVVCNKN